jgi:hypothetical protein
MVVQMQVRSASYTVGSELARAKAIERLGGAAGDMVPRTAIGVAADVGVPFASTARGVYEVQSGVQLMGAVGEAGSVLEGGAVLGAAGAVGAASAVGGAALAGVVGEVSEAFVSTVEHVPEKHLRDVHVLPHHFAMESYKRPTERADYQGYQYDTVLSNEETAVWHNHNTKTTFVSHRGSITPEDFLLSDAHVLTGTEHVSPRFKHALNTTLAAHSKYGYQVEGGSHSLGGSIDMYLTEKLGGESWFGKHTTFNMGSSPFGKSSKPYDSPYAHKISHVRQKSDLVSMTPAAFGKTFVYNTTSDPLKAHSLDSFGITPLPHQGADVHEEEEKEEEEEEEDEDEAPEEEQDAAAKHHHTVEELAPNGQLHILGYVLYPAYMAREYEGHYVAFR